MIIVSSLQSVPPITCMLYPTTLETLWEAITPPTAGTRHWGSGTATMTPGIRSQRHRVTLTYHLIRLAQRWQYIPAVQ